MTQPFPSGPPRRPARSTQAAVRRESARDSLIRTATYLFRRFGVHPTSIDDIVAAAGLTKSTLYRHFASKEDLVVACLREEGRQTRLALAEAVGAPHGGPSQRIRAIGEHFAAKFADAPNRGLFALNLAVEYSQPETLVRATIRTELEQLQDQVARLIAPEAPAGIAPTARKLVLAVFGASVACQAVGATACEHLAESVDGLISEFGAQTATAD